MVENDVRCNVVHDTTLTDDHSVQDDHSSSIQGVIIQNEEDLAVIGRKITAHQDKVSVPPDMDLNISSSAPTERASDATSVRSLPAVQVSESTSPGTRPATARSPEFASGITDPASSPFSGARSHIAHDRRRSAYIDNRVTNRFSGFISNLIHRRDTPTPPPLPRQSGREGRPTSPTPGTSEAPSRSSSPSIPVRPGTPPPPLPPPTLHELGLDISMVTSILSPSHFSSPPTSGAFLSPHYLLLCHAQGLDVIPLASPPAAIPYALVRRVSFKHVVVMEQRGVLVAIAGRRDGVRVYALDEVRKAVEWRIEVELRREQEKARREDAKRIVSASFDDSGSEFRGSEDRIKAILPAGAKTKPARKSPSIANPLTPRSIATKKPRPPPVPSFQPPLPQDPPPYTHADFSERRGSVTSAHHLIQRSPPVNNDITSCDVMVGHPSTQLPPAREQDIKSDWLDDRGSSDEEAIDIVAAGASGSQALDERTSTMATASPPPRVALSPAPQASQSQSVRRRPTNLDLSRISVHNPTTPQPPPSPTPTLLTLRQALQSYPSNAPRDSTNEVEPTTPDGDDDDFEGPHPQTESISLAQALIESRLPDLPPAGTRRPQQPILISPPPVVTEDEEPQTPRASASTIVSTRVGAGGGETRSRMRRRWSVFDGVFTGSQGSSHSQSHTSGSTTDVSAVQSSPPPLPTSSPSSRILDFSQSGQVHPSFDTVTHASTSTSNLTRPSSSPATSSPAPFPLTRAAAASTPPLSVPSSPPRSRSRFIPRIISDAFNQRGDKNPLPKMPDSERAKTHGTQIQAHASAPKLEYVKLPGTKGALLVKAVETAKKSFLAILCGDHGEKVELFAGTYRTALGLSRTFILPDSPRSLELQLQGDDLVEVFLVFSQNVFGLEPATVRVREVRIGRAERRAARRRARDRENLLDEGPSVTESDTAIPEDGSNVTVSVSVSTVRATDNNLTESRQTVFRPQNPEDQQGESATAGPPATSEELAALVAAQASPYTTFQQLAFSPNFPLASIADEYIIPPTYASFMQYRSQYEPELVGENNNADVTSQLSPPGLPLPVPLPPCKWFYRDPKGVVHGPWKASLMQAWYKDGLLPPDLPVRREEESEYVLLKELRLQCIDPAQPFCPSVPQMIVPTQEDQKPLLRPISLLAQPPHFGPPALFFSSRGGHSTTIVDARGRLVLKGRFFWSQDDVEDDKQSSSSSRMGDVKRLEAIDMDDRSVLVAMRQGGLEAVDLSDALLRPADGSRVLFPHFNPPPSSINRRGPFVWKMGTPICSGSSSAEILALKPSGGPRGSSKKAGNGPGKSPGRTEFLLHGVEVDGDHNIQDEILFFGRKNDNLYLCERNSGSFRILRLCPSV